MSPNIDEISESVRRYLLNDILPGVPESELTDSTPLITGGILDSFATIKLVAMLEEQFGVDIQAHEATMTHLNTVATIASLVFEKRKGLTVAD